MFPLLVAFLPEFAEVDRGQVAMQIAVLGLLFTSLGIVTDGCRWQFKNVLVI